MVYCYFSYVAPCNAKVHKLTNSRRTTTDIVRTHAGFKGQNAAESANMGEEKTLTLTHYDDIEAFVTKEGTIIRELMHPNVHGNSNLSIAEAIVAPGKTTLLRKHHQSEEIYHITAGSGTMQLVGKGHFTVHVGDTICIDPGTEYNIINTSDTTALKIIAMSSPPFQPNDTVI